jgi:hypothetical protein
MQKRNYTWLWIAAIIQYLTAALHTTGFFIQDPPANETETQLVNLMKTYKMDLGAGFHPSMNNLFVSMSVSFTLLLIFGGILNNYLLKKKPEISLLKGFVTIQTIIFGIVFVIMVIFTFLIPIICTGLIFLALLISLLSLRRQT